MNKYNLVVLCGKSGAGKDYLLRKIHERNKDKTNLLVSDTTRPMRSYEEDGIDYFFVTENEFEKREHIEEACFNGWYYGTPLESLNKEKINLCILNPTGIRQVYKRDDLNIKLFYLSAPAKTRMIRQLERDEYPNILEICRRFLTDEEDFKNLYKYSPCFLRNATEYDPEQCIAIIEESINELSGNSDKMN